jgi:hypothetical protein
VIITISIIFFRKSASGALDFSRAAEFFIGLSDPASARDALVKAAFSYERAGKPDEARIALVRAASLEPFDACIAYEPAVRGIDFE